MANDERKLLAVLKAELAFLEHGGYHKAPTDRSHSQFIFEDSPTCLNFGGAEHPRPCSECVMTSLVPADCLGEKFPCRHITLNKAGFTADTYYRLGTFEEAEACAQTWLHKMIVVLEAFAPAANSPGI